MIYPVLTNDAGWAIALGLALSLACIATIITNVQRRYLGGEQIRQLFITVYRDVKPSIIALSIVSSWTWTATLLQSSTVAYKYGLSGPYFYAAGATIQVLLFAILAIKLKEVAPTAHTFLEIINARYEKSAHIMFLIFGLATNVIVTSMLLIGGSAVLNVLSGVDFYISLFLLPFCVVIYKFIGGVKETFIVDYVNSTVILIIILYFAFVVYGSSSYIGSPYKMYNLLVNFSSQNEVSGNEGGSYVTLSSSQGLQFGIISTIGNFGTIFVDNAYWQRAIAVRTSSTVKACLIGGLSWFAIPFTLATTMGLSGIALVEDGRMNPLNDEELSAGLVLPTTAAILLGKTGAIAVLVLVFMAVMSATSAELVSISSIYTYDIYVTYINENADEDQINTQSYHSYIVSGIAMSVISSILHYIGVDLGYMYLFMGIITSPAVIPIFITLTCDKKNFYGVIIATILGLVSGISVWLGVAIYSFGEISIKSTGSNNPMLYGNLASITVSGIVAIIWSLFSSPSHELRKVKQVLEIQTNDDVYIRHETYQDPLEQNFLGLKKAFKCAIWSSVILTIILAFVIPLIMIKSKYIFTEEVFVFWVVLAILWAIISTCAILIYPLYESRKCISKVIKGIISEFKPKK